MIREGGKVLESVGLGRRSMRLGLAAALHLAEGEIVRIEFIPLLTQNRIVRFQPRIPSESEADQFLLDFLRDSLTLGAHLEQRGGRAVLELNKTVRKN